MQAIRIESFGDPTTLAASEVAQPEPSRNDVIVEVRAAAVNPSDVKNVQGAMKAHTTLPRIIGRDFAGSIVAGPPELRGVEVFGSGGDLGFTRDGTHARYVAVPRDGFARKPERLTFEEAACVGVAFVTAYSALINAGELAGGETVAVSGAAGAVGSAGVQIAAWRGARVIGIVRDEGDVEPVRSLGAHAVLRSRDDLAAQLRDAAPDGVDLAFDTVSGPLFETLLDALAQRGRMAVINAPPDGMIALALLRFYRRDLRLLGVNSLLLDAAASARILDDVASGFETGRLRPPSIARRHPLARASQAYADVLTGTKGKVVLTMND